MPGARELARAARLGPLDEERLARNLYRRKADEYRRTLLALGRKHGLRRSRVALSEEIRNALRREAEKNARQITGTYNRMVERFIQREIAEGTSTEELIGKLPTYMRERKRGRVRVIQNTAATTARLDAQANFYIENGVEPLFDFTGPGPDCPICTALKRTSPHPVQRVLEIGLPHIGCNDGYRVSGMTAKRLRAGGLQEGKITLGRGTPAGIIGSRPLDLLAGGPEAAARRIYQLAGVERAAA